MKYFEFITCLDKAYYASDTSNIIEYYNNYINTILDNIDPRLRQPLEKYLRMNKKEIYKYYNETVFYYHWSYCLDLKEKVTDPLVYNKKKEEYYKKKLRCIRKYYGNKRKWGIKLY